MSADLGFVHQYAPGAAPGGRTLLLLHGTGGDEKDLVPVGQMVAAGTAMLSPRGKVLENGAPRFFRRLAEGVFDLQDLAFRTQELAEFVRVAAVEYGFALDALYALGYSNGANIAANLLLTQPDLLAGAMLFRPMLPAAPATPPALAGKPIWIARGQFDTVIPAASTQQLIDVLQQYGANVTVKTYPVGHGLLGHEFTDAKAWLQAQE